MKHTAVGNRASNDFLPRARSHGQERNNAAGMAALDDGGGAARAAGIGRHGNDADGPRVDRREISHQVRNAAQGNGHDTGDPNEGPPVLQRPADGKDGGDHAAIEPDAYALVNGTSLAAYCRNCQTSKSVLARMQQLHSDF